MSASPYDRQVAQMVDSIGPRPRSELWRALQGLTDGLGVQREDLKEALAGKLSILRDCWSINLRAEVGIVRRAVVLNLNAHIQKLQPGEPGARSSLSFEQHGRNYRRVVAFSFGLLLDKMGDAELRPRLMDRRKWLAENGPKDWRVSVKTSQRYLEHAISQIERQIIEGYEPIEYVPEVDVESQAIFVQLSDGSAEVSAVDVREPTTDGRSRSWIRRNVKWAAPSAAVVVAAAVTVPILVIHSGSSGAPPRTSSSNGQPVPVAMVDGPVHVDNVAYERDGTGKSLGYSWIFPQKVQLSADELTGLNKLAGNSAGYQDWMLGKGGVNPNDASIQLTVRNKTDKPVVLTDVKVDKQCSSPLSGTLFFAREQGPVGDVRLALNLDDKFAVVKNHATGGSYFAGDDAHTIQLAPGETSTLLIDAMTKQYYCQFHLNLVVDPEDGGSPVSELVDFNGKPFAVTAVPEEGQYKDVKYSYFQAVYAYYQDPNPADVNLGGLGFGSVNPVTYPKG